jgi:hypothetical protein
MKSNLINIEEGLRALVEADVTHFIGCTHSLMDDRENIMVCGVVHVAMGTRYHIHI